MDALIILQRAIASGQSTAIVTSSKNLLSLTQENQSSIKLADQAVAEIAFSTVVALTYVKKY
ncbi:hypothetical protein H6G36_02850 [Anabaena minutissima FACHB-250]|nr:hypothetical protein [Anabaena minutissima FACHB-250]